MGAMRGEWSTKRPCFAISKPAVFFCQKLAPSYLTFLPSTVSLFAGRLSFTGVVGVSGHTGKTMESRSVGHVYIGGRLLRIAIQLVLLHNEL